MKNVGMVALLAVAGGLVSSSVARDWPSWRGPNRDGIASETGLLREWTEAGPPLVFQAEGLGGGFSSVAVVGDSIFTMGQFGGKSALLALDRKTGQQILWKTDIGPGEPNCTPTVDDGRVYALGREGDFVCVDAKTGKELWRVNFQKDFGGRMMSGWGYSESPLIDGDRVIVTPGSKTAQLACLDRKTGKVIWTSAVPDLGRAGGDGAGYSSVVISRAAGVKQYVQLTGRGVVSVDAESGKFLWNYNRVANGTANIPTPIVKGDHVFTSTGYGDGGTALLHITKSGNGVEAREVYYLASREVQNHHGGMILLGDHVYMGHGHNNGFPLCLELMTGKVAWNAGRGPGSGSAAIVLADGHLYFRYQNGVMGLIEASPTEYQLKGQFKLAVRHRESWPHPVIVDGLMYLRDQGTLLCYDIRQK